MLTSVTNLENEKNKKNKKKLTCSWLCDVTCKVSARAAVKIMNFHRKKIKMGWHRNAKWSNGNVKSIVRNVFERNNCVYVAKFNDQNIQRSRHWRWKNYLCASSNFFSLKVLSFKWLAWKVCFSFSVLCLLPQLKWIKIRTKNSNKMFFSILFTVIYTAMKMAIMNKMTKTK